jgi:YCII-related domain
MVQMTKYLVLYRAKTTAAEQMAQGTPEQAKASMDAWMAWAQKAGDAVVDLGAPLGIIEPGGDSGDPVGGYSILQAESADAVTAVLQGHPHTAWGGTIEILEALQMPGM